MIENYTSKEYADKAVEANALKKMLYILLTPTEFEKTVLDFTTQIVQQPIFNEDGEQIGTEDVEIQVPVMIEKEVPIYDEEGNQTGVEVIKVQSSHKEKYMEDIATLVIAEPNYYICTEDNYTYGDINENLETEKIKNRTLDFYKNFIVTSWGAFRKTPKGYSSAVEAVNTVFNMVNVAQALTEDLATLLIFYEVPDFTKAEQCTEEWLVAHQKKHKACDLQTFMSWYLEFQTVWAKTQYTDIPIPEMEL